MRKAPKSVRLQIGLFGRTNVGKSSFLNMTAGQDTAITSPVPGTTTDVVEKTMELLPIGPVVFLDTAGIDDVSTLSDLRLEKTRRVFDRSDVIILIAEAGQWGVHEDDVMTEAISREIPVVIVVNKTDLKKPEKEFMTGLKAKSDCIMACSSITDAARDEYVHLFKQNLIDVCPKDFMKPPAFIKDLVPVGGVAVLIVPIDFEAPKGRLILPQVQVIRDVLDSDASAFVVKEDRYVEFLKKLKDLPDLVICDSQVVARMVSETPEDVRCTTFSILFARNRGSLADSVKGSSAIRSLAPDDKVLVAEACSHHPIKGDIGREKIPRWLEEHIGGKLDIDVCAGRDYPEDLRPYKLVIHCGGCMITSRETAARFRKAEQQGVPITNYGVCISFLAGVLDRVISPFPECLVEDVARSA